jgi:hypothetical protein
VDANIQQDYEEMEMISHAGSEFTKKLADALGVDRWRRIIIDIAYDSIATIYVETFLDEEKLALLNLDAGFVFTHPKQQGDNNDE